MNGIGSRIREARRRAGFTQAEFGKLAGVSQSYLSEVERGKAKPSIEILVGLSEHNPILNLHWLLTGEGFKEERTEYIGGDMTRRVTILRAVFLYINELTWNLARGSMLDNDPAGLSDLYAGAFYQVAAAGMDELERAYDRGETNERVLAQILRKTHQSRRR